MILKETQCILGYTFGTKYSRMDLAKSFKGYLPQILLDPFLITLPHFQIQLTFKFHK